jgi:hypothetical protein
VDLGSNNSNKGGAKKFVVLPFFCGQKCDKVQKIFRGNLQNILVRFGQEIVTNLSKIRVWDQGVKKAPDPVNIKKFKYLIGAG